jgi:signal transduction histidine kinase/DNA-binding response OmpR family regulator
MSVKPSSMRRLKRAACLMLALAVLGTAWIAIRYRSSQSLTARSYRIGWENDPPIQVDSGGSEPTGLVIEIVREAARRRHIRLQWIQHPEGPEAALRSGAVDFWPIMRISPERRKFIYLGQPYLETEYQFVIRSTPAWSQPYQPLQGIVTYHGMPVNRGLLENFFPQLQMVAKPSMREAIAAVCSGESPVAFGAQSAIFSVFVHDHPCPGTPLDVVSNGVLTEMAIGATFDVRAAADALREEISAMAEDGTLRRIAPRWLNATGHIMESMMTIADSRRRLRIYRIEVAGLIALLALTISAIFGFRRERNRARLASGALSRDIARRKEVERELTEARLGAESANRAKDQFVATVSHEIRTPMNAILGMAEMLWESDLDRVQRDYVEIFRRAGADLMTLINDLLDLSKIEAGQLELELVEFDLEEPLDQAMELIASRARAKSITLLCRLTPGTCTDLIGDPTRLRQILINLLGNSVKFTTTGEVVLTVQNADRPGSIKFSVRDTGIGIPPDKLDSIFQSFRQADSSTTRKFGGTGLGLGISRSLVEQMGGNLEVESVEGQGSTFHFTVQFGVAPGRKKDIAGIEDLCGQRALLIDDNAINRLIQSEALASWGMESDDFATPERALGALSGHRYSVAIVDSRMPHMDGFETARRLHEVVPDLPVIMLTSDAQPGDAARRVQTGISGYAVKPVKRAELLRLVCQVLRGNAAHENVLPAQPNALLASENEIVQGNGLSILIAEDSTNNRKLIQAYLKASPHRLTFVEDGEAAVDRFESGDFDLVLMDIQMPVMDGLEATRSIRAYELTRGLSSTPIVALTANASARDVDRCRGAGCTAHLSKPISKRSLFAAIATHSRERQPIRIEIPEGLEDLATEYMEACKTEYSEMLTSLTSSDFERVKVIAHNMRGEGACYGFPGLTEIGATLERAAKQSDHASVSASLHRLGDYLGRIRLPENLTNASVRPAGTDRVDV